MPVQSRLRLDPTGRQLTKASLVGRNMVKASGAALPLRDGSIGITVHNKQLPRVPQKSSALLFIPVRQSYSRSQLTNIQGWCLATWHRIFHSPRMS